MLRFHYGSGIIARNSKACYSFRLHFCNEECSQGGRGYFRYKRGHSVFCFPLLATAWPGDALTVMTAPLRIPSTGSHCLP